MKIKEENKKKKEDRQRCMRERDKVFSVSGNNWKKEEDGTVRFVGKVRKMNFYGGLSQVEERRTRTNV